MDITYPILFLKLFWFVVKSVSESSIKSDTRYWNDDFNKYIVMNYKSNGCIRNNKDCNDGST